MAAFFQDGGLYNLIYNIYAHNEVFACTINAFCVFYYYLQVDTKHQVKEIRCFTHIYSLYKLKSNEKQPIKTRF